MGCAGIAGAEGMDSEVPMALGNGTESSNDGSAD